jgi:clan AA aspartic protease
MMAGNVRNRHAMLPIPFRLPGQPDLTLEVVVDTGFTGHLALPPAAATAMGLSFLHRIPADLADDSTIEVSVYAATILWNGAERTVRVLATGRRPLVGTALLEDCELVVQFVDGGLVTIDAV